MKTFTFNQNDNQLLNSHFASSRKPKAFTIIKKIAKHGKQAIIIIPKLMQAYLKPDAIVELKIKVLEG